MASALLPPAILGGAMDVIQRSAGRLAGSERAAGEDVARDVVAAAVWAPSLHNTQPWWFGVHGREMSLYADASRQEGSRP
jgi:hypothetical protein